METKFDFDIGLRHQDGMTANLFIQRYCEVFRPFAYATKDDSLNEFEKLITHVLAMYAYQLRRAELLGLPSDPRESVESIEQGMGQVESAKIKLAAALYAARGDLPDYSVSQSTEPDEITRFRAALEKIKEHQKIWCGTDCEQTGAWQIADEALKGEGE